MKMQTQDMKDWRGVDTPNKTVIEGHYITLEPLNAARHAASLWQKYQGAEENWRYLLTPPFATREDFIAWLSAAQVAEDTLYFAIVEKQTGSSQHPPHTALGIISYLRIDSTNGVIEIGHLNFSPALKQTRMATDALYSMIDHAFALGYRRVEWKCDNHNQPSKKAALRLGFTWEGVFRQHRIVKGLNRDTAWFSLLDYEWPEHRRAFQQWLAEDNFTSQGKQRHPLAFFRRCP
ncbi:hypothetical protein LMG33818_002000 [Halomonadaceae bacterium LMG 33818]|uniref:GNAT family N-acetyltransferase n=1 Tax=Cernens ardua TaxID=3402176 RepID=UPI003EDBC388